jgi:ribosomal-protein-alanine N-acetyltransferase
MTEDIIIRVPDNAERKRFYEVYRTGLPGVDDISEERFNQWWTQSQESGLFDKLWRVAVLNDEVVGVVINVVKEELSCGFVWELAVAPEHRGEGIGSRLISHSEKCLLEHFPSINSLGIGVKTENYRALGLYEKLGYGMHFVVLRLQGQKWSSAPREELSFRRAESSMVDSLLDLDPDAYWDSRDRKSWLQFLKDEDQVAVLKDGTIVGFVRLVLEEGKPPITEILFHARRGYGESVLDACMELVKTEIVEVQVQDSHQEIIESLYGKGFRRMESEFLLRKKAR